MIETACAWTITILYIYLCIWELDLRLNNVNYFYWYFSSSVNHHILILNLWNTIQLKYHNQWVSYLWYICSLKFIACTAIRYWSSNCHSNISLSKVSKSHLELNTNPMSSYKLLITGTKSPVGTFLSARWCLM